MNSLGYFEKDALFIELCIDLLKDWGQLIIVLPDNKFSGKKFQKLREWILDKVTIEAVISLHPNTFRPFTQQKASILVANKSVGQRKPTLFIKSENCGKLSNGYPVKIDGNRRKNDYEEIVRVISEHRAS